MDNSTPKDVRSMSRDEYRKYKREMISGIARTSAEQRDQRVLDQLANAKDDNERRRILRQHSR